MSVHDPVDRRRFPADPWCLREVYTSDARSSVSATLFGLANGYMGIRGDGDPSRGLGHGTFVNGFHETYRIRHAEDAYGFASVGQVIQGVPDAVSFRVAIDGDILGGSMVEARGPGEGLGEQGGLGGRAEAQARLVGGEQVLDFRRGTWVCDEVWSTPSGRVRVQTLRMVALYEAHLGIATVTVTPLDSPCQIAIFPEMDASAPMADIGGDFSDPRLAEQALGGGFDKMCERVDGSEYEAMYRCRNSRMRVALGVRTEAWVVRGDSESTIDSTGSGDGSWRARTEVGHSVRVVRYLAYHADDVLPVGVVSGLAVTVREPDADLLARCADTLNAVVALGVDASRARQAEYLAEFWKRSDIQVEIAEETLSNASSAEVCDEQGGNGQQSHAVQQSIRWCLYQLAQVSAQAGERGVPAKGLSGSGYSGHYFWDSEAFVLPFLVYTNPRAAKDMLMMRHQMLPAARKRAEVMACQGALYPWRTINGEEASAYYPAGTAQYHIDADIAYAVIQYANVADDKEFLAGPGLDVLVETARMWAGLGFYGDDGSFHIHAVTGPDEYSAVVDDNYYTNAMAAFALRSTVEVARVHRGSEPLLKLGVDESEIARWENAARRMCLPFDEERGVHPQDAHFMERQPWDFAASSGDERPLLLRYHPLVIYRHQVLKQADLVAAIHRLSDWFTPTQKQADFAFYEPLTTGDSSLSAASQAIVAFEVSDMDRGLSHLEAVLHTDVGNTHGNTSSGVHIANAGGAWLALVAGIGGLRDTSTAVSLDPRLPVEWSSMNFRLTIAGSLVNVAITHEQTVVELLEGAGVDIRVCETALRVVPDAPVARRQCFACEPGHMVNAQD